MFKKNIKIILILTICLFGFKTTTYAMKETNENKIENIDENIVEINQKTIASFKRKLKDLISPLVKQKQKLTKDTYDEILSFICLNADTTLNENKLILKLKELNLIENNNNINYFVSDDTKIKLEKSLLNSNSIFADIILNSSLKAEKDNINNMVKKQTMIKEELKNTKEELKNTNELMKSLLKFNDIRNESNKLLIDFLKTSPMDVEEESIKKIENCYNKMEKHNQKIRNLCEKADALINKKDKINKK